MTAEVTLLNPPYRIDIAKVDKGTIIIQAEIERLVGFRYLDNPDHYKLSLLRVIDWLQNDLDRLPASDPRRGAAVRERRHGVRVLTDVEASIEMPDGFEQDIRRAKKKIVRVALIDRTKLNTTQLEQLESRERVMSRMMNAALNAKRVEHQVAKAQLPSVKD